jgi:cardiolipin synthase (CMP-forming)
MAAGRVFLLTSGSRGQPSTSDSRILTAPNLISVLRLSLVYLAILWLVYAGAWSGAFWTLWLAAFMDGLDGYVARRFNQASRVGAILDPVFDRVAMVSLAVALIILHLVAAWFAAALLARDLLVAAIAIVSWRRDIATSITLSGKVGTILLFFGVPGFMIPSTTVGVYASMRSFCVALVIAGAALYYWSFFQYARSAARGLLLCRRRPSTAAGSSPGESEAS